MPKVLLNALNYFTSLNITIKFQSNNQTFNLQAKDIDQNSLETIIREKLLSSSCLFPFNLLIQFEVIIYLYLINCTEDLLSTGVTVFIDASKVSHVVFFGNHLYDLSKIGLEKFFKVMDLSPNHYLRNLNIFALRNESNVYF